MSEQFGCVGVDVCMDELMSSFTSLCLQCFPAFGTMTQCHRWNTVKQSVSIGSWCSNISTKNPACISSNWPTCSFLHVASTTCPGLFFPLFPGSPFIRSLSCVLFLLYFSPFLSLSISFVPFLFFFSAPPFSFPFLFLIVFSPFCFFHSILSFLLLSSPVFYFLLSFFCFCFLSLACIFLSFSSPLLSLLFL